jgi:hypothetical protein
MIRDFLLLILVAAGATSPAAASCFDRPETQALRQYAPQPELLQATFLIDESVMLPEVAQRQMMDAIARLARPGNEISVGFFSSYSGSRFPQLVATVRFDTPLPEPYWNRVSRRARDLLAACIAYQHRHGILYLQGVLGARFRAAQTSIAQSDIMSSILQFSERVRQSLAREKIVVVGSDMLENSSTTSFYRAGRLRLIDPVRELHNAAAHNLFANLGGARIYLVGFALQPGEATVPVDLVQRLEQFWTIWFQRSRAGAVRIGKPVLLGEIR